MDTSFSPKCNYKLNSVLFQNLALSHGIEHTTCKCRDPERPSGSHDIEQTTYKYNNPERPSVTWRMDWCGWDSMQGAGTTALLLPDTLLNTLVKG